MSNAHRVEPCPTVPVQLFSGEVVEVDAGVASLVSALTALGIPTHSSCEGHPKSEQDSRAYVVCEVGGVDVELRIWPEDADRLALHLGSVGKFA